MPDRKQYRTKCIGVRVRECDFTQLRALADAEGKSLGEWSREILLERLKVHEAAPAAQAVVSEVLALRTILLNVLFSIGTGKPLTEEEMIELIERADAEKLKRAMGRLRPPVPVAQENVT